MEHNKIRIMFIIPSLGSGGAEKQLIYLINNLDRKKCDLHLCVFKEGGINQGYIPSDVKTLYCPNYKNIWRTVSSIISFIKRNNIILVNTFLPTANFYGFFLRLVLRKKVYLITSQRGVRKKYFNKWTIFEFLSHNSADIVVANSQSVKENVVSFLRVKSDKVHVIYNGISVEEFDVKKSRIKRSALGLQDLYPVILSIGRFDLLKGHQYLIRSVEILLLKGIRVYLLIVGEGVVRKELHEYINKNGLSDYVRFFNTTEDLRPFFASADCFVLATISEGLSNVVMEAMASALPVITTDIPPNRELVDDGTNGFLVLQQKPDLFAEKIEEVLKDPEKMAQAGNRGREKMKKRFSIERMVRMYENLYKDT